jgi:hypothetical protein
LFIHRELHAHAALGGEVVWRDREGRPRFSQLMFGRAATSVLDGAGHRAGRLWTK